MEILKIDIVNDAATKLRINGLTTTLSASEVSLLVNRLDAFVAGLPWDIGYIYPDVYGGSDVNEVSGIEPGALDSLSTLLADAISGDFGKQYDPRRVIDARSNLARQYVEIEGSKFPTTLPVGIANEWPTFASSFYRGGSPSEENDGTSTNGDVF